MYTKDIKKLIGEFNKLNHGLTIKRIKNRQINGIYCYRYYLYNEYECRVQINLDSNVDIYNLSDLLNYTKKYMKKLNGFFGYIQRVFNYIKRSYYEITSEQIETTV